MGRGLQRAFAAARRTNKFGAVKTVVDGITFDSKAEARRYGELKLLEKAGEIKHLIVHPVFEIVVRGHVIAKYKADFRYWPMTSDVCGRPPIVEDVKSPPTAKKRDFVLIRKLMKAIHGIDVEIVS